MTADEIRNIYACTGGADCKQELLAEIAAQLAELNARLTDRRDGVCVTVCSSNDTIPVKVIT